MEGRGTDAGDERAALADQPPALIPRMGVEKAPEIGGLAALTAGHWLPSSPRHSPQAAPLCCALMRLAMLMKRRGARASVKFI